MWTRSELKEKAKASFRANYWKCVLVGLLITAIVSGLFAGVGAFGGRSFTFKINDFGGHDGKERIDIFSDDYFADKDVQEFLEEYSDGFEDIDDVYSFLEDASERFEDGVTSQENTDEDYAKNDTYDVFGDVMKILTPILIFIGIFMLIAIIIGVLIDAFLFNPLYVGCNRFFLKNLSEPAMISDLGYGYDHNYKTNVITILLKDVFTFLWTLLFIIPGIVKSYEYRMIPYLLAENPNMTRQEAFAESRAMMQGQKWRAFVLDLSFLGWWILNLFTFGLLKIFYIAPYQNATNAALFEALRYNTNTQAAQQF